MRHAIMFPFPILSMRSGQGILRVFAALIPCAGHVHQQAFVTLEKDGITYPLVGMQLR